MKCLICKQGEVSPGSATVTLRRGERILIFKDVPAEVCDSCAEYYLSEEVTEKLLQRAEAAIQSGAELEILRFITADQIGSLWGSRDIGEWRSALACYWNQIKPENIELETFMNSLTLTYIETLDADGWYAFLHDKYFPWKFTQENVLRANLQHLEKYKTTNRLEELLLIKERFFSFALAEIEEGLKIALEVKGLGAPGASGLLAILFPKWFGTVDQFVVKTLARVESLPERPQILQMQPKALTPEDVVLVIDIMRRKAQNLNTLFNTDEWTPRKIDMILWAHRCT
jgi:YgiT-type zinc finger domain-containing protein